MKKRLDTILVERQLVETRNRAQAMIMAGSVMVGGDKAFKSGQLFPNDVEISIKSQPKYVSRGGDKLSSVAKGLGLSFGGKIILDVGSSTGGFSDFALYNDACRVYAVDVGNNQLHYRLRTDQRVIVMERTDIRSAIIPEKVDLALVDVSFISMTKVLVAVSELVKKEGQIVVMAKPQFEADKATADRFKGIISDKNARQRILDKLEADIKDLGFVILASKDSSIPGVKGNLERFYLLK